MASENFSGAMEGVEKISEIGSEACNPCMSEAADALVPWLTVPSTMSVERPAVGTVTPAADPVAAAPVAEEA